MHVLDDLVNTFAPSRPGGFASARGPYKPSVEQGNK